jgi:GH3 auxin-responsive promoter
MTLAPRFLVSFMAGLRLNRFKQQLKVTGHGVAAQEAIFARLLGQIAKTQLGARQGISPRMDYQSFRESQPLVEHRHYQSFIESVAAGESGLIWPGACRLFVDTAGSTTGTPRRLPVTAELLQNYRAGLSAALFSHAQRVKHAGVFLGRHLHAGASTALEETGNGFAGNFHAINRLALSPWVEANLYSPPAKLDGLPDGPDKINAVADHMLSRDVTMLGGTPAAVRLMADAVRTRSTRGKARITSLQALWPNLECFLHTGAPLGLLTGELRALLGPDVSFMEVYAAAEGWFAVQDGDPVAGLRLLTDAGIFFEFLPMRSYDDTLPAHLSRLCVPLAEVQTGIDYALVITTPAGLCRYVVGDIVRFVSLEVPHLQFVGRTRLQLALFGEHVSERELTESLFEVCARHSWVPVNFHVSPLMKHTIPVPRGGHEWWVELRPGTVQTPTGPLLAKELDEALAKRNRNYAQRRQSLSIEPPVVRLVMPGIFEQWAGEYRPHSGGNFPCCRPDRQISDQLTAITRFHTGGRTPIIGGSTPPGSGG